MSDTVQKKVLKQVRKLITADGRVPKSQITYDENKVVIKCLDGFYLDISAATKPMDGPVKLKTIGDAWQDDYQGITDWIGRHFK